MTKSIDQLLRETLNARSAATPPTGCLDAETAGAFADGTLTARERSSAEAHVADCARCQALLAALARMTPPAVARAWWRRPAIAWMAPLTVAATAVIVWIYVPRQMTIEPAVPSAREGPRALESDSRPALPTAAAAPQQAQSARDASAARAASGLDAARQERDQTTVAKNAAAASQPNEGADGLATAPLAAQGAPAVPEAAEARRPSAPSPQAAAASEPPVDRLGRTAAAAPAPQPTLAETVTVTSATPEQVLARRFARDTAIVSSSPISRWRIGTGGVVEHSADGGSTWQTQSTGVTVTLTAGSSPSPSVCWLVGPRGVVVITTDEGRSWQRLSFPVEIDLISVRAIDDTTATVVTSDGRTFTTSDRGRTWRP
jgi:hypothetical protein